MSSITMEPADTTILREAPFEALRSFITPTPQHFILAALGIVRPNADEWKVTIGGSVKHRQIINLSELRALPSRTLAVTLECAGDPLKPDLPVRRVSTTRWKGAPLIDVLERAQPLPGSTHVWIDGSDRGVYRPRTATAERVTEYRKDLPLERIRRGDVLLAYEMNGAPLPPEHGYPLRLVVPGYYGTNSVKWVDNVIVASGRPSGLFASVLYNTAETVDGAIERRQVAEVRVNSLLTSLRDGEILHKGRRRLAGWAWGSDAVARVQLRIDDGEWFDAEVEARIDYAWQSFEADWEASQTGHHTIFVRATDCRGNVQPPDVHINQIMSIDVEVI